MEKLKINKEDIIIKIASSIHNLNHLYILLIYKETHLPTPSPRSYF